MEATRDRSQIARGATPWRIGEPLDARHMPQRREYAGNATKSNCPNELWPAPCSPQTTREPPSPGKILSREETCFPFSRRGRT